jgi:MHS family proline/betaine transporter-like MFS transporter
MSSAATIDPFVPPAPKRASGALQIAAATIGNALEWFDILIYGYFATSIAGAFFPNSNPVVSLLLAFGSFGLSYVARPVGAVVLGAYADRAGRKAALALSIRLMVIGTAVMALMPSYATIGLVAPIAVFSARLLQGFAVAGEFGSSTAFMIEHSAKRKAFFASWQFSGQNAAKMMAALFGFVLTTVLAPHQLQSWGWRIPFLFGLLVGPVGIYIRRKVEETPEFLEAIPTASPIGDLFAHHKISLLLGAALIAVGTANTYFGLYIPTYATRQLHLPPYTGYVVTVLMGLLAVGLCPVAGHLADRLGYTRIMLPSVILMLLTFYPVMAFITRRPSMTTLAIGLTLNILIQVTYSAAVSPMLADIFPANTRVTGISLSYNLGVTLFGGFAPAIFTWLTSATHDNTAPAYYLMATALITIAATIIVQRRFGYGSANAST